MIVNVILAILVLSVIIIVHEFGHFIVAKANGVTVLEFALGFGPKLIHFKKGEPYTVSNCFRLAVRV